MEICDLKNFLQEGGTLFFVVYFDNNGDNVNIYYKTFLPYDLVQLLKTNENKKTCSIKFKPFPNDSSAITDILINFAKNKSMQAAIKSKSQLFSYEELSKKETITITIPITSHKPINDPVSYLFKHDAYVYATTPSGFHIPVDHFDKISMAQSTLDVCISVKDVIYYKNFLIRYEENHTKYLFGKSFTIDMVNDKKKLTFNFKLKGTLSERIEDCTFFLAMINNNGFTINKTFLPLSADEFKGFDKKAFKQQLDNLIKVKKVLQSLDVTEELNMDNMTDSDYKMLSKLVSSFDGNEIHLADIGQPFGFFNVGNLKILISTKKNDETGLYRIYNFYEPLYRLFIEDLQNKMHIVPLFMGLKSNDLEKCSNFNSERLLKEFSETQYDDTVSESVIHWLLELIKAYDKSTPQKSYLLETAHKMIKMIRDNDKYSDSIILRLNELQIIKRMRTLNFAEKAELYGIITNYVGDNIEVKIGAYILLDERTEAERLLASLPKEHQEVFMEYPIYSLLKLD